MVSDIKSRLRELKIESDSELGKHLTKLDSVYSRIEDIQEQIVKLEKTKAQLLDDADMMETIIMYKFNKGEREQ